MSFNDFLNSNKSYEMFAKSSGLEFNKNNAQRWAVQRVLIRGIIIFIECFCLKNKLAKIVTFKTLALILNGYADEIENSQKKEAD